MQSMRCAGRRSLGRTCKSEVFRWTPKSIGGRTGKSFAIGLKTKANPSDVFVLDLDGVLYDTGTNSPVQGVSEVLSYCEFPFYVVSAMAAMASSDILKSMRVDIGEDSPRLFAKLDSAGKKADTLREIGCRPLCKDSGAKLHYVEDQFETIRDLHSMEELKAWTLHLAEWGNSSEDEREQAKKLGISILSLHDFCELLKWGLLMGVDDGCEPTPEEVTAQVYQKRPT